MTTAFDQDYWDNRYAGEDRVWSGRPNPVLVSETVTLPAGRALDIGCGEGADTIWLAGRGWHVTGVDFSAAALERAAARALQADDKAAVTRRIIWEYHDLTEWVPPRATYDLVSSQFMHLPSAVRTALFGALAAAVSTGGTLLIVGHDVSHNHGSGHSPDPDLFFTAREVAAALDPGDWRVDVAESRPRSVTGRDGAPVTVVDAVVSARRR